MLTCRREAQISDTLGLAVHMHVEACYLSAAWLQMHVISH